MATPTFVLVALTPVRSSFKAMWKNFRQLVKRQQCALASAMFAYDRALQFKDPREDMIAFLKACVPIVYTDYGKTISHYGGLRIAPRQVIEYAAWGKARQLAWDRAMTRIGAVLHLLL